MLLITYHSMTCHKLYLRKQLVVYMRVTIDQAVSLLREGKVVALPTETVYGLAASVSSEGAINQVYSLKGRPAKNPLILHISSIDQLRPYLLSSPPELDRLVSAFWPGPLTLVLAVNADKIPERVRSGLKTAAFRVPGHALTREVIARVGPLVMPSANLSGKPSSTDSEHVEHDFGSDFPVLDGGRTAHGLESTILTYLDERWWIARLGAISAERLAEVLGYKPQVLQQREGDLPIAPGQLYRHYAPNTRLVPLQEVPGYRGIVLGFADREYPKAARVIVMGALGDPEGVASNLYGVLRQLDEESIVEAAIDLQLPEGGLWPAILDRLRRAAQVR